MTGNDDLSVKNVHNVPSYAPPADNTLIENETAGLWVRDTYPYGIPYTTALKGQTVWDIAKAYANEGITYKETLEANPNGELIHEGDPIRLSSPKIKKSIENVKKAIQYYGDKYYFEINEHGNILVFPKDEIDIATITEDFGVSWQNLDKTNDFNGPGNKEEYSIGDTYIDEVGSVFAAENGDNILNGRIKQGSFIIIDGEDFDPNEPILHEIKEPLFNAQVKTAILSFKILKPILKPIYQLMQKSE